MSFKISTNKKFILKNLALILFLLVTLNTFCQSFESISTDVKIQRLSFLIEQMYVEDVDQNKIQKDLVLGMFNYLRPMVLFQNDSVFKLLGLEPSKEVALGFTISFKKGKILVDSVFNGTGAHISKIQKKDQIISIDSNNLNKVYYYSDFISISNGEENSDCLVKLKRNKDTLSLRVNMCK